MTWLEYHLATSHSTESLRENAHSLNWANMPDPFRHYESVPVLDLPADPPLPGAAPREVTGAEVLSQLLFYSAAISATKVAPSTGDRYALRVNPSSGNLHPTEFHFCTRGLRGWPDGLYHYRPSSHMAEQRALGNFVEAIGLEAPLVFILTTIAWREVWKYQCRAYRYCLLDIGHGYASLAMAASAMGCVANFTGHFHDDAIAKLCGLSEDEAPLMMVAISGGPISLRTPDAGHRSHTAGEPSALSPEVVPCALIDAVHEATKLAEGSAGVMQPFSKFDLPSGRPFVAIARTRRSALDFIGGERSMAHDDLFALLTAADPVSIELYLYVHRVTGLEPGLYTFVNHERRLHLLHPGDQRVMAAALSLRQDLAGNACVAFSMVANLHALCAGHGPRGYRYAHFEAGAIGQRLYLTAEALGMRATGIGAFFDDEAHRYLGLSEGEFVLYHFAVGYPIHDTRLEAQA